MKDSRSLNRGDALSAGNNKSMHVKIDEGMTDRDDNNGGIQWIPLTLSLASDVQK